MRPSHFVILIFSLVFPFSAKALAAEIPVGTFHVSQERFSRNGVLVSRPVATDAAILRIIANNQIRTIEDYVRWLQRATAYQSDKGDDWATAQEFLKKLKGDCEDYAIFNRKALEVLGFKAHVVTLHSSKGGHAICAFEYNNKFYWLDNDELKSSQSATLLAFGQELTERFHYSSSRELDPATKTFQMIYSRI